MKKSINNVFKRTALIVIIIFTIQITYGQNYVQIGSLSGLTIGNTISVPVYITSSTNVGSWQVNIYYNRDVLTYSSITSGGTWSGIAANNNYTNSALAPQYPSQKSLRVNYTTLSGSVNCSTQTLAFTVNFTYNGGNATLQAINQNGTAAYSSYLYNTNYPSPAIITGVSWTNGSLAGPYVPITSVSGGGNWSDITKWDLGHVPNATNNVIIASAPSTPMIVNTSNTAYGDLTINSGGALTINSGITLTVNGNLTINSDASGTGSFLSGGLYGAYTAASTTVQRYVPAWPSTTSYQGWHQISSPVAGNALTNFTPSPASSYDFLKWDEPTLQWLDQKIGTNGITSFLSGLGYMVSYQNAGTHNFSGSLTTADVSPALSYTAATVAPGWNLIGNPYTSAIDASNFMSWTKTNVNDYVAVYYDDGAQYRYWNGTVGNLNNNIIPAMQAFWVRSNAASPSITIPASSRVHNAQNLYKSSSVENVVDLTITSPNGFTDEAFVYFTSAATNGLDQDIDVPKLTSPVQNAPALYSFIGSDKFAINAMGSTINGSVPLGFVPGTNGSFTFKANQLSSFDASNVITLQDLKTGLYQNLMQNDTYPFTANTTDNPNRFILIFNSTLGIGENTANIQSKIYSYDNNILVNCTGNVKQISIYNTIGQLIYTVDKPTGLVKYSLSGNNTTGYYVVRVISDTNVNSEKVFVK